MSEEKAIPEPIPYNFILSPEMSDSILCWGLEKFEVEKPSFAVLLDHTLAVIWHCFYLEGCELFCLNKADIMWALRFLEAIDISQITEIKDLETLMDFFRKTLITRYALEDEKSFLNNTKTMYDSMEANYTSNSSALEEFISSPVVQEEMKHASKCEGPSNCTDVELLERLKLLNPNIKSLDDVKNCLIQSKVPKENFENANLTGSEFNPNANE